MQFLLNVKTKMNKLFKVIQSNFTKFLEIKNIKPL